MEISGLAKPESSVPDHEERDRYSANRVIVIGNDEPITAIVNRWQMALEDLAPDFQIQIDYAIQPENGSIVSKDAPIDLGTALKFLSENIGMVDVNIDIVRTNPQHPEQNFSHPLQITRIDTDTLLRDYVPGPIKYTIEKTKQIILCAEPKDAVILLSLINALKLLNPEVQIAVSVYSAAREPLGVAFVEIEKKATVINIDPQNLQTSVQPIVSILNQQLRNTSVQIASTRGVLQTIALEPSQLQQW